MKYTRWIFEIYTTLGILMVYAKYTQKYTLAYTRFFAQCSGLVYIPRSNHITSKPARGYTQHRPKPQLLPASGNIGSPGVTQHVYPIVATVYSGVARAILMAGHALGWWGGISVSMAYVEFIHAWLQYSVKKDLLLYSCHLFGPNPPGSKSEETYKSLEGLKD